jgi:hypothetical protein
MADDFDPFELIEAADPFRLREARDARAASGPPPQVLDVWSEYSPHVRVIYIPTGLEVPLVFSVDCVKGECWQYVEGETEGGHRKMRRLSGDFRVEWNGR